MPQWLSVVSATLAGVAVGGAIGWPLGRRLRGRPARWLVYLVGAFAVGCYLSFVAMRRGERLLADAWLGFAFGAMTGIKYGGGILPSLDLATKPARPADGSPAEENGDEGSGGERSDAA